MTLVRYKCDKHDTRFKNQQVSQFFFCTVNILMMTLPPPKIYTARVKETWINPALKRETKKAEMVTAVFNDTFRIAKHDNDRHSNACKGSMLPRNKWSQHKTVNS